MALRLVIAEKPSVAQTIAAALGVKGKQDGYIEGGGYLISWCVGHLVQLAEAAAYGEQYRKWQLDSLPILPEEWQYAVDPDKGKQFATLKELMHRTDVERLRRGARGRIDIPLCLRSGGLQEAHAPLVDFLNGGRGNQGGLCFPQRRAGI